MNSQYFSYATLTLTILWLLLPSHQAFGVTESFDSGILQPNWQSAYQTGTSNLTPTNQRLEFTNTSPSLSATYLNWGSPLASTLNWSITVDIFLNSTCPSTTHLDLLVGKNDFNLINSQAYASTYFKVNSSRYYFDYVSVTPDGPTMAMHTASGTSVTFRMQYSSSTGILSMDYRPEGGSWNTLSSQSISLWNMTESDNFQISIGGESNAVVASGEAYFDNFTVTTQSTPEPSSWALLILSLGAFSLIHYSRVRD